MDPKRSELKNFKARWEHLHFSDKCGNLDPSRKADVLRLLMAQAQWAQHDNILDCHAASSLWLKYADKYSAIVDSPEQQRGVNNYAESALALLEGKPNESKLWTSSLKDKLQSMKCVQNALAVSKAAKQMIIPEGKENEPLILSKPPNEKPRPCKTAGSENSNALNNVMHIPGNRTVPESRNQNNIPNLLVSSTNRPNHSMNDQRKPGLLSDPRNIQSNVAINQTGQNAFSVKNGQSLIAGGQNGQNSTVRNGHNSGWQNRQSSFSGQLADHGAFNRQNLNFQPDFGSGDRTTAGPPSLQRHGLFSSVKNSDNENTSRNERYQGNRQQSRDFDTEEDEDCSAPVSGFFKSAREQLAIDNQKKFGRDKSLSSSSYGNAKKSLGTRRGPNTKFVPPVINRDENQDDGGTLVRRAGPTGKPGQTGEDEIVDERLKNIEPKMVELITNEIMDHGPPITWDDIAGLEFAKNTIKEIVVWPMLRPDIFTGLRGPPKGLLLFGPPGTGKTLIGKCIASQSKSTFFSISASSLTSKWVGEGEKMVRALFAVARVHQPAVIFLDEIDSLLSQRCDGEQEASRRIKTEFLVQLDGATTSSDERILCVGATNRPQEIDEAARRRFVKRLYIPLPEFAARQQIVVNLLREQNHSLTNEDLQEICEKSDGYSGADVANLCREAALGPIRSINFCDIENITADQVRPITGEDFKNALKNVRPSVSSKDLVVYLDWNKQYGTWDI